MASPGAEVSNLSASLLTLGFDFGALYWDLNPIVFLLSSHHHSINFVKTILTYFSAVVSHVHLRAPHFTLWLHMYLVSWLYPACTTSFSCYYIAHLYCIIEKYSYACSSIAKQVYCVG